MLKNGFVRKFSAEDGGETVPMVGRHSATAGTAAGSAGVGARGRRGGAKMGVSLPAGGRLMT